MTGRDMAWTGTVTALIQNFGRALAAEVPMAEAIGMGWQEHDAYDDWDAIANALYVSFVARPIAWASSGSPLSLAPYDLAVDERGVLPIELWR